MMTSSNGNISTLLAIRAGNSPVTGEFPAQRPVTRSFDIFFNLRLNERLSKQSWGWWHETNPLWRHCNILLFRSSCISVSLSVCSPQCENRCYGAGPEHCCHPQCMGGCHGPYRNQCWVRTDVLVFVYDEYLFALYVVIPQWNGAACLNQSRTYDTTFHLMK